MHTSMEGLYQSCIKIGENLNFVFIYLCINFLLYIYFFFWGGVNMGINGKL